MSTLIENLKTSYLRFPDKPAIVHNGVTLSYNSLWTKACGLANMLVQIGVKKGDRVSLLLENSAEYVISYYGVLMSGAAVIGLNTAAKSRDLSNWIGHSGSEVLIASAKHPEINQVIDMVDISGEQLILIDPDRKFSEVTNWQTITDRNDPPIEMASVDADNSLASIIYTSGTTGHPKGVMLSHTNLYENTKSILTYLNLNESDSVLNVLPFYYSYGNSVLHIHISAGATLYLENSMLYPQKVVNEMAAHKVTGFSGVPSTYNLLLSRIKLDEFDLSSLRYLTQAGGPMAPAHIERVKKELPNVKFFVMYGQTEASARLSYLPPEKLEEKLGSIGIAIPGVELEVMNQQHDPVPVKETGEIYARGKNIMMGYWDDQEMTEQVMHGDWLKTGDLAYKDEDGYFYIVGRSSEMIKSGAHRISPKDIEEVILEIDGIEEAAVVGVSDDLLGQVIKAVIVKTPASSIDKMQIMRHCKTNLANYKIPKFIEFVEQIPRTASGKVRRFMIQN